jgi:hypothetical protein
MQARGASVFDGTLELQMRNQAAQLGEISCPSGGMVLGHEVDVGVRTDLARKPLHDGTCPGEIIWHYQMPQQHSALGDAVLVYKGPDLAVHFADAAWKPPWQGRAEVLCANPLGGLTTVRS